MQGIAHFSQVHPAAALRTVVRYDADGDPRVSDSGLDVPVVAVVRLLAAGLCLFIAGLTSGAAQDITEAPVPYGLVITLFNSAFALIVALCGTLITFILVRWRKDVDDHSEEFKKLSDKYFTRREADIAQEQLRAVLSLITKLGDDMRKEFVRLGDKIDDKADKGSQ